MAANSKTMNEKLKITSLADIAEDARLYVKSKLPLVATNTDLISQAMLTEKTLEIFNGSFFSLDDILKREPQALPDVKKKLWAYKIELLGLMLEHCKKMLETKVLPVFSAKELKLLPTYIAEKLEDIFFFDRRQDINNTPSMFQRYKRSQDIASITGIRTCGNATAMAMMYILEKYGHQKDIYPIARVELGTPGIYTHSHCFFILNFQGVNVKGAKYCDYWLDKVSGDIKNIIPSLPEPLRSMGCTSATPVALVVGKDGMTEDERAIILADNPHSKLKSFVHFAIKRLYKAIAGKDLPKQHYLLTEEQEKTYHQDSLYKTDELTELERKALDEFYRKMVIVLKMQNIRLPEGFDPRREKETELKDYMQGLALSKQASALIKDRPSRSAVTSKLVESAPIPNGADDSDDTPAELDALTKSKKKKKNKKR